MKNWGINMGVFWDYTKEVKKLRRINKLMKKNKALKDHFDKWLEEHFETDSENEVLKILQKEPYRICEITNHYEEIKGEYE